ncbi:biliverdin-producing heme oxygenase [Vampirovibrio sp.]|uniref:biliverdin-producing heme oxygenase n=1 Tax=Vampirovibrio sp. TaxID=2717857 RepID=UPI003593AAE2
MISDLLKTETACHHEAIENAKRLTRLGSEDFSKAEYIELLEKFYGFYQPLERAFGQHPEIMDALAYHQRFKLPLLQKDLMFFDHTPESLAQLPECTDLPPTETMAQALGCIYVMEGSTHGSQFIAKRLRAHFNLESQGLAFYEGYGKDTMSQWKAFKTYLDESVAQNGEGDAVVHAAGETFQALHRWMDQ